MPDRHVLFYDVRSNPLEFLPACYAARRLGLGILLITNRKRLSLPKDLVSEVRVLDTADIDASVAAGVELARTCRVAGVTTWSDKDVITAAMLTERLGLPGPSVEAARTARNKYRMRAALAASPELIPRYAEVTSLEGLLAAAEDIGYPAVLKPTSGGGSAGIFEIHSPDDLRPAFDTLAALAQPSVHQLFLAGPGQLIYEEFLTGSEHSVEGIVSGEGVSIAGITDKTTLPPHHTEIRHRFPSALPERDQAAVRALTDTVVSAFGLRDCAFHLECKVEHGRARLIECAARIGGDFIASHLVPLATGQDLYAEVIRTATGEAPRLGDGDLGLRAGVVRVVPEREGVLAGFPGLLDTLSLPGVEHVCFDRTVGDRVLLPPNDYVGHIVSSVIARTATDGELGALLDQIDALMRPAMR
jgi:biotin carboxylase